MKEAVYGFYPPARDVWAKHSNEPDSYIKECLYRHRNTRFSSNPTIGKKTKTIAETTRTQVEQYSQVHDKLTQPPRHGDDADGSILDQRQYSSYGRQSACTEERTADRYDGIRPQIANTETASQRLDETDANRRPGTGVRSRLNRKSTGKLVETVYTDYSEVYRKQPFERQSSFTTRPFNVTSGHPAEVFNPNKADGVRNGDVSRDNEAAHRIQANPEQDPPQSVVGDWSRRRSSSAASTRRSKTVDIPSKFRDKGERQRNRSSPVGLQLTADATPREINPASSEKQETSSEVDGVEHPMNYDEQLKKYGWRMEIPGDPLHLKRQYLLERRPTSVVCTIPTVLPMPPRIRGVESNETFFYGTVPCQPMSFTVHPDWASELIVAHRVKLLQKRSASAAPNESKRYPYNTRDFSFIY